MAIQRVTQNMLSQRSLFSLQSGLSRLSALQEQLSTGRVLNRPSDSPTDTTSAMRLRSSLTESELDAITEAMARVRLARIAYERSLDALHRLMESHADTAVGSSETTSDGETPSAFAMRATSSSAGRR